MYWAVTAVEWDRAWLFPSYPLALKELNSYRANHPSYEWHIYSLSDATPPADPLTTAYEEEG